jgi:hypothetical protein
MPLLHSENDNRTGPRMLNRREFIAAVGAQALVPAKRPNLLYVLVDQLSGLALPVHDSNARMPNCQSLAKAGVTFTHAYTAAMTCGPSRASLDTGLYPPSHGVGGGTQLSPSLASLPQTLARNGYVLSHPRGYSLEDERKEHEKWLVDLGYEQPLSSIYGVESTAGYLDLPLKWKCGRMGLAPEHAFDAYCAQRAIRFLETNRTRPFACFLQLRGPHDPYEERMSRRARLRLVQQVTILKPHSRIVRGKDRPFRELSIGPQRRLGAPSIAVAYRRLVSLTGTRYIQHSEEGAAWIEIVRDCSGWWISWQPKPRWRCPP